MTVSNAPFPYFGGKLRVAAAVEWKTRGGYGNQGDGKGRINAARETLWVSPQCAGVREL